MKTGYCIFAISIMFGCLVHADVINLGTLSYDTFIPGAAGFVGVDAFNISNLNGTFNLPPDFPVLDNLTFQSASLTLSDGEVFMLGDIGPGFLLDGMGNPVIQVPANKTFQSAEFTATLSSTNFAVPAGTFIASSNSIDAFLLPSQGPNLTADVDGTTISVSGQLSGTGTVPEPASWSMLLILFTCLLWNVCKRNSARR